MNPSTLPLRPESRPDLASRPFQTVYTIVERERDGQSFWLKIGAAFTNRDGSLHVKLDAMPTNGQLHIRESKTQEERKKARAATPPQATSAAGTGSAEG